MIDALKREDNVLGEPKAKRGEWAAGLAVKDINTETCEVIFHAGCRYSYDPDLRETVRGQVQLMLAAGADVGIAGAEESCCGGRAYELGYRGEAENYADDLLSRVKASGAKTLVTPCADGYAHLKYLYPRMGKELPVEVLHTTQYLERLAGEGRLRLRGVRAPAGHLPRPLPPGQDGRAVFGRLDRRQAAAAHEPQARGQKGHLRRAPGSSHLHPRGGAHRDGEDTGVLLVLRRRGRGARGLAGLRPLDRDRAAGGGPRHRGRGPGHRLPLVRARLPRRRRRVRHRPSRLRPRRPGHALGGHRRKRPRCRG